MSAASPAEWLAAGSLGVTAIALVGLGVAFVDADLAYFDPRPLLGRARDRFLIEVVNARRTVRDAALSLAALLMLLNPAALEGDR